MTEALFEEGRPRMGVAGPVKVRVPAKINLHLAVGPLRADGYHELTTVYQAISLYDEVTARRGDQLTLTMEGEGAGLLPLDGSNLVLRAARALAAAAGVAPHARLHLRKQIPVAGGLAGGAAPRRRGGRGRGGGQGKEGGGVGVGAAPRGYARRRSQGRCPRRTRLRLGTHLPVPRQGRYARRRARRRTGRRRHLPQRPGRDRAGGRGPGGLNRWPTSSTWTGSARGTAGSDRRAPRGPPGSPATTRFGPSAPPG